MRFTYENVWLMRLDIAIHLVQLPLKADSREKWIKLRSKLNSLVMLNTGMLVLWTDRLDMVSVLKQWNLIKKYKPTNTHN